MVKTWRTFCPVVSDVFQNHDIKNLMYRFFLFLLSFFAVLLVFSCAPSAQAGREKNLVQGKVSPDIRVSVRMAALDYLGHLYVVDQRNRVIHFTPDKKEAAVYANTRSGQITGIDVSNPFQILVFYDDFNSATLLDNMLVPILEINFESVSTDVSACGVSNDGHFWVFDPVRQRLVKTSRDGRILAETSNLADVGMAGCQVSTIREKGNVVVLCDPSRGFYFFDNLGQYQSHFPASDILSFTFDGRFVTYFTPTGLKRYSLAFKERTLLGYPIELNHPSLKYLFFDQKMFYAIYAEGIVLRQADSKQM